MSDDFFDVLGQQPLLGRVFDRRDRADGARVAVVGERLWRRAWDADPDLPGREITIGGPSCEGRGSSAYSAGSPTKWSRPWAPPIWRRCASG